MPRQTPVYRLPYVLPGESVTGPVDRTRFMAIDRQLEAIFTFLGNGIISGWNLQIDEEDSKVLIITPGSGVISSIAAASTANIRIENLTKPTGTGTTRNNIYVRLLGHTAESLQAEYFATTETFSFNIYLSLGYVNVDSSGNITSINTEPESGRTELEIIRYIASLISQHVHTGQPGEPDKIDLFNHVRGVLSATNIEDLPASKITSGTISKDRFKLSHEDLLDIGTLKHEELDFLVEKLQTINQMLFGDIMTSNLIQLIISMKHTFSDIDDYMVNFASVIPGLGNNKLLSTDSFIDINATTSELDFTNHRIRGKFVDSKELGQIVFNTVDEFNEGTYDSNYILVTGSIPNTRAYGYGYGYGFGLNYWDVVYTNFETSFDYGDTLFDFDGSLVGYGVSNLDQNADFETTHSGEYAYGYGFEYAFGIPDTLTTTLVTLNPIGADLFIFDEDLDDYVIQFDEQDGSLHPTYKRYTGNSGSVSIEDLLVYGLNKTIFSKGGLSPKRGSSVADPNLSGTTDAYVYSSRIEERDQGDSTSFILNDKSMAFAVWDDVYDTTENRFLNFVWRRVEGETFNSEWTYDYSMSLYIEVTVKNVGSDDIRYYYRYTGGSASSSYRFFQKGDTPFVEFELDEDGIEITTISAELTEDNLEFIVGFVDDGSTEFDIEYATPWVSGSSSSEDANKVTVAPSFTDVLPNITGWALLTTRDDDFLFEQQEAGPMRLTQGKRLGLSDPVNPSENPMLARIDKVFFSGSFGYSQDLNNNKLEGLEINFPYPVDFESISWLGSEPSDSVIYIQVKRNASPISGGDSGESDFRDNFFFTNKGELFQSGGVYNSLFEESFGADQDDTERQYSVSGSSLPGTSYDDAYGITLRVVLLPSSDKRVAPALNSLTINFSSNTSSGTLTIDSADDWQNARVATNIEQDGGSVKILETSRTNNLIYGSFKKVVEYKESLTSKYTSDYSGSNLPQTALQKLNDELGSIVGLVTDLKVLENGNIMFLDRDSSRIVEVDKNRNIKKIIMSEFAFDQNYVGDNSIPASQYGELVKVIYNRQLGPNGCVYLVFSHELSSFYNGVKTPTTAESEDQINVRPSALNIRFKGLSRDFSDSLSIQAVDRGTLAFFISPEMSNWIESITNPYLDMNFFPSADGVPSSNSSIKFNNSSVVVRNLGGQNFRTLISKVGNKGIYQTSYNLLYVPIQGAVAFDYHEDSGILYTLKRAKEYSWDSNPRAWYLAFNIKSSQYSPTFYTESNFTVPPNIVGFPSGSFLFNETEPSFFLDNYYGHKGSIQFKDPYLLICVSGEGKDGVYVFSKNSSGEYSLPTPIELDNDGTYPMDARFDPKTFDEENSEYGNMYVALSDLKRSPGGATGRSRIVRYTPDGAKDWEYGGQYQSADSNGQFFISANSVRPLSIPDDVVVVVST